MSGLQFVSADPATNAYNQDFNSTYDQDSKLQARNVDAAERAGVADMIHQQPPANAPPGYSPGAMAIPQAPMPPTMPRQTSTAPIYSDSGPSTPMPGVTSISMRSVTPSPVDPIIDAAADKYGVPRQIAHAMAMQESSKNPGLVGAGGDTGLFQVLPSTAQAPGYGVAPTDPSQLKDPAANADFAMRYLVGRGTSVNGGQLDWSNPTQRDMALRAYNAGGDPNYVQNVLRYAGAQPSASTPGAATPVAYQPGQGASGLSGVDASQLVSSMSGQPGAMPGQTAVSARFNPLLERLAATPGGGSAALALAERQPQYDMSAWNRQTQYGKLGMAALARGDATTAQYFLPMAGVNLPPQVFQNAQAMSLIGKTGTLAHQIYQYDPAQARVFTDAVLNGQGSFQQRVSGAFDAAGVPASNPSYNKLRVINDAGNLEYSLIDPRTGQAQPVNGPNGQPAQPAPRYSPLQSKADMILKGFGGDPSNPQDTQMAAALATGMQPTPQQMAQLELKVQAMGNQAVAAMAIKPEEREAYVAGLRTNLETVAGLPHAHPALNPAAQPPAQTQPLPPAGAAPPPVAAAPPPPAAAASAAPPPAAGGIPPRPATVPPGSMFSQKLQKWRSPAGNMFDARGTPIPAA